MLISAIICTYNGQKYIHRTLNSLANQSLDCKDYEIVVVDNHSTDNTPLIVSKFKKENPNLNLHYCLELQKGLSFARNKGIQAAKSSIIVYIDDDAEANNSFLKAHLEAYQDTKVKAAGGKVVPEYSNGQPPIWFSKYLSGVFSLVDFGDTEQFFFSKISCWL
ncbi:MAG: glycosyltransferase family 2 protein [Saprospiraceae bacterium]|nr:glycosyltransferase family 2 protein [Saprospiraceae bacterium]